VVEYLLQGGRQRGTSRDISRGIDGYAAGNKLQLFVGQNLVSGVAVKHHHLLLLGLDGFIAVHML